MINAAHFDGMGSVLAGQVSPLLAAGPGRTYLASLRVLHLMGGAPALGDVGFRQHRPGGLGSAIDVHEQTPSTSVQFVADLGRRCLRTTTTPVCPILPNVPVLHSLVVKNRHSVRCGGNGSPIEEEDRRVRDKVIVRDG